MGFVLMGSFVFTRYSPGLPQLPGKLGAPQAFNTSPALVQRGSLLLPLTPLPLFPLLLWEIKGVVDLEGEGVPQLFLTAFEPFPHFLCPNDLPVMLLGHLPLFPGQEAGGGKREELGWGTDVKYVCQAQGPGHSPGILAPACVWGGGTHGD